MSCCCPPPVGANGGGIAAVAAMAGIGIFVWLNLAAIITFLLLLIASLVLLMVTGVGAILFAQRFMLHSATRPDIADRLRLYAATRRPQTIPGRVEASDDGLVEKSLERGSQGRARAIHAAAREAALNHDEGVPGWAEEEEAARPEPRSIRDWVRGL